MTIQFDLSDLATYKQYFKTIAESNNLLLQEGTDQYLYGDIEIGINEAASWKGKKLWAMPAHRARGAGENDNYYFRREGTIWVGGPAPDKFEEQDTYYEACQTIIKQIISKMIADFTNSKLSFHLNTSTIERTLLTLSATHIVGCEFTFFFDDPDDIEFNQEQWQ